MAVNCRFIIEGLFSWRDFLFGADPPRIHRGFSSGYKAPGGAQILVQQNPFVEKPGGLGFILKKWNH